MAIEVEWHVVTGTAEKPVVNPAEGSSADNINLLKSNKFDVSSLLFKNIENRITQPSSGNAYSIEVWVRFRWSGTGSSVSNAKVYLSDWTPSDDNLELYAGETDTFVEPVNSKSTVATSASEDWDTLGEAIDITPEGGISSFPAWSDYLVLQLEVPNAVETAGEVGDIELTLSYDET